MSYTDAQIAAALVAPARNWRFRYTLLDTDGVDLGPVDVAECTVRYADLADIKRTASLVVRGSSDINFATERIRPEAQLRMRDGGWQSWPLGVFMLSSPTTRHAVSRARAPRAIEAFDLGLLLRDDKVLDRYTVAAGSYYLDPVRDLLGSVGLPTFAITGSDRTLPAAREFKPGTSKAEIINAMLDAINFRPLQFDGLGIPQAVPYLSPQDAPPLWTYDLSATSMMVPGIDETLDLSSVANAWVLVVSEPDRPELRSTYINDHPASPTSTVNVRRRIVDFREDTDAADQDTLDAKVLRLAEEASQVYAKVEWNTGLMPIHGAGDVVRLDFGEGLQRYRETEWEMKLAVGELMNHKARRVVTV